MGSTIYYELGLPHSCARITPRERLEELWSRISRAPVLELTSLFEYAGTGCGPDGTGAWGNPGELLKTCASGHLTHPEIPDRLISIDPLELIGFVVWVGSRVEPLTLGLARYPETIAWHDTALSTGLPGWRWHASCKTHYARVLGIDHFARCHHTVITALDLAGQLGFTVKVQDDTGYATHRDIARLVAAPEVGPGYGRAGPAPALV